MADQDAEQPYPLTFHMVSDDKAIGHEFAHQHSDAIENLIQPHGHYLVDLFWRNVQPCYPLLFEEGFMQQYKTSYRLVPAELLGAVYLSALRWWSYEPGLSIRSCPDSAALRKLVLSAIQDSYHRPKLSSIQATLILLQCQPEDPLNPDHTFQWGLTCQALAVAQCIGLHLDTTSWSIPRSERNVRKRLSWALYMQDRWTALAYGRPVHLHVEDWGVSGLVDADFVDTTTTTPDDERSSMLASGRQQFMHMVNLSQILSTILSDFYTVRSSREQDTVLLYKRAMPIIETLELWSREMPPALGMDVVYQRRLSFHGSLHLSFYGVQITLLRRLIRSTPFGPGFAHRDILSDIRQRALHAAQSAVSLVATLRPDQVQAFWYFTSPYLFSLIGSFITLLLVTSLSSQERSFWQESLNSYLWTLRTMSGSSEPMQYAANRLEGAILRGLEHALAVSITQPVDDATSLLPATSSTDMLDFVDFGDWDLFAAGGGAFDWPSIVAKG